MCWKKKRENHIYNWIKRCQWRLRWSWWGRDRGLRPIGSNYLIVVRTSSLIFFFNKKIKMLCTSSSFFFLLIMFRVFKFSLFTFPRQGFYWTKMTHNYTAVLWVKILDTRKTEFLNTNFLFDKSKCATFISCFKIWR